MSICSKKRRWPHSFTTLCSDLQICIRNANRSSLPRSLALSFEPTKLADVRWVSDTVRPLPDNTLGCRQQHTVYRPLVSLTARTPAEVITEHTSTSSTMGWGYRALVGPEIKPKVSGSVKCTRKKQKYTHTHISLKVLTNIYSYRM